MLRSLREGCRSVGLNWGLVVLVLATNLAMALVLAVPLALQLDKDLAHRGASSAMMYGFDYDWWSAWSEQQRGPASALAPEILGTGFMLKNLELLLKGWLPLGLFARGGGGAPPVDPVTLGLGGLYLALQAFLTGGLVSVFRRPRGGWTLRGLVHGCGFYFGRMVRLSLLALGAAWLLFALNAPLAAAVDRMAREAVSSRSATLLVLGRHALLLAGLLLLHMVVSHARVLVVREERLSVVLAAFSSLGFCGRRLAAAFGQYVVIAALGGLLLALFGLLDSWLVVVGYKTQLVALVLFEAFMAARIALRLWLLAAQVELQREPRRASALP
jgi:hypothetical protein